MSDKISKDYCSTCGLQTNHKSLFKTVKSSDSDEYSWIDLYEIIQCLGCENIQFRNTYSHEEMYRENQYGEHEQYDDVKYYPANFPRHRPLKNFFFLPHKISVIYNETLEALKNNCYILAGVGVRTIIEAVCLDRGISGKNLETKINNLTKNKLITEKDANRLHSIRFLGNDSVHEMDVPKEEKLRIALDIVEYLIKNLYLIDIDVNAHLDVVIYQYDDFKKLVLKKIKNIEINAGDEKSIKEVLGKDYRRIERSYVNNFILQLTEEVNAGLISSISVGEFEGDQRLFMKNKSV